MLTKKVFDDCIEEIETAFTNFTMTKRQSNVWYKYSDHLTDQDFLEKTVSCIRGCHRTPTLADILDQKKYYEKEKVTDYPEYKYEEFKRGPIPKDIKDKIAKITKNIRPAPKKDY